MQNEYAGQIIFIKCSKIISAKENEKNINTNIVKLSNNIKKNGIIQPLNVRPLNYGIYEIISGEKRFIAAKLAGLTSVPCIVTNIDERTAFVFSFIENSFKTSLSIFDESEIIKKLIIDYKYSIEDICSILSLDNFEIIDKLKLLHFSKENRIKAENAKLSFKQCVSLLKLEDTKLFDKAVDSVINNHLSDFQTEEFVNKLLFEKRNTVLFKDIRIFTNTISNAIEKMKSAGINVQVTKNENDEKIKYSIVIFKRNNVVIKSHKK